VVVLCVEVCKRSWLEFVSNVTQGVLLPCHQETATCSVPSSLVIRFPSIRGAGCTLLVSQADLLWAPDFAILELKRKVPAAAAPWAATHFTARAEQVDIH
jgi:hypothetical protein